MMFKRFSNWELACNWEPILVISTWLEDFGQQFQGSGWWGPGFVRSSFIPGALAVVRKSHFTVTSIYARDMLSMSFREEKRCRCEQQDFDS